MQTSSFLSVWFFYLNRYITFQSISLSLCLPLLPLPLRTHTHTQTRSLPLWVRRQFWLIWSNQLHCWNRTLLYSQTIGKKLQVVHNFSMITTLRDRCPALCTGAGSGQLLSWPFWSTVHWGPSCFLSSGLRNQQTSGKERLTAWSSVRDGEAGHFAVYFRRGSWPGATPPTLGLGRTKTFLVKKHRLQMGQVVNSGECLMPPTFVWI